jgi:hypothetical protein
MGFLWILIGAAGAYIVARKLNEIPVLDEYEQPPTKYTRVDPAHLFDKLGATSVNGLSKLLVQYDYKGKNQFGVPMWDCYFSNGSTTTLYGSERMANLLGSTLKENKTKPHSNPAKRQFKNQYSMGLHQNVVHSQK